VVERGGLLGRTESGPVCHLIGLNGGLKMKIRRVHWALHTTTDGKEIPWEGKRVEGTMVQESGAVEMQKREGRFCLDCGLSMNATRKVEKWS
jgi:hypothetical protein